MHSRLQLRAIQAYVRRPSLLSLFYFHDPPPPKTYPLSLHDALPISIRKIDLMALSRQEAVVQIDYLGSVDQLRARDRKSTRLNSSHTVISYAVFCLKKKKEERREAGREGGALVWDDRPQVWLPCDCL